MIRLNKLDYLFDTKEKRFDWVYGIVIVYALWQCIWQSNFFIHLIQIVSYESLFFFYNHLDQYTTSLLVRMIYAFVLKNHFTFTMTDFLCAMSTLILLIFKYRKLFLSVLLYLVYMGIELTFCLHVREIDALIHNFHRIALISLIYNGIWILFLLYKGIGLLLKYINKE